MINLATEQLIHIFSTVVRKALRKRKHCRCKKEIAKADWFDKECQKLRKELRSLSNKKPETLQTNKHEPHINKPLKYTITANKKKADHMKMKLNKIEAAVDQNYFGNYGII